MELEAVSGGQDDDVFPDMDDFNSATASWNGRDISYQHLARSLRKNNSLPYEGNSYGEHFRRLSDTVTCHKSLKDRIVRGVRHLGRKARHFEKKHRKEIIIVAAAAAVVATTILTAGSGAPAAAAAGGAALAALQESDKDTPSKSKQKSHEGVGSGSKAGTECAITTSQSAEAALDPRAAVIQLAQRNASAPESSMSRTYPISSSNSSAQKEKREGQPVKQEIVGQGSLEGKEAALSQARESITELAANAGTPAVHQAQNIVTEAGSLGSDRTHPSNPPRALTPEVPISVPQTKQETVVQILPQQAASAPPPQPSSWRTSASMLLHEVWDGISKIGSWFIGLKDALNPAKPVTIGESKDIQEAWKKEAIPAVHEAADKICSTNVAALYDDKVKNQIAGQPLADGLLPPPVLGLAGRVGKVESLAAQSGKVTSAGEKGIATVEKAVSTTKEGIALLGRQVNTFDNSNLLRNKTGSTVEKVLVHEKVSVNPIRIQPSGIWEVNGRNIQKLNMEHGLAKENKMNHLFDSKHNLSRLGGTQESILQEVTAAVVEEDRLGRLSLNQPFEIQVKIRGHTVTIRGTVVDGELKYGTFFIPD